MNDSVVFFDKDGTLVEDVPYNVDPARIRLVPGAPQALCSLAKAGFRLAVVSNQSGVARGFFPEGALLAVEARIRDLLGDIGVELAAFYYCPHHPEGVVSRYAIPCECRKPGPGMIVSAARDLNVEPSRCWVVGDILDDVEAGRRAGCQTVLIDNGNETEWLPGPLREPHFRARDIDQAARIILEESGGQRGPSDMRRLGNDRSVAGPD